MRQPAILLLAATAAALGAAGATAVLRLSSREATPNFDSSTRAPADSRQPLRSASADPIPATTGRTTTAAPQAALPGSSGAPVPPALAMRPAGWQATVAPAASAPVESDGRPIPDRYAVQSPAPTPARVSLLSTGSAPIGSAFQGGGPSLNSPNGGSPAPLAVELDRGVQAPVALSPNSPAMTPAQAAMKQQIARDFANQINQAVATSGSDPKALESTWSSARAQANWQYEKFFGSEAANRAGIQAALEALAPPK